MPKVDTIQTSFAGGEFGPSLRGRTDVAQYQNACEIVENFLIRPYGSAISTPGTRYVNETKLSALGTDSTVRIIQFIFNRTDAYVIEMGVGYFRFYTNGSVVVSSGTTPYEIAHTYAEDELFDVQFTQLNDVIWLTHPNHKPKKLTRISANSWTLADFEFLGGPFLDDNTGAITITPSDTNGNITITLSATSSTIYFVTSDGTTRGHVGTYWKIGGVRTTGTSTIERQGYVQITAVSSSTVALATVKQPLTIASATTDWAEGAWSDVNGWPSCVTFHERRLFFARTDYEPQKIWGSKTFVYDDFSLDNENDDDGLNLQLASNESNEIQWLTSGKVLVAGTYGGAFIISSGNAGEALTPSNVNASPEASFGAEKIQPKKIGNFFYYVQRFGQKLRELFYFWDLDTYKAENKTIFSPHIAGGLRSSKFVDLAYQQEPDTILWCVRDDGQIATMTREVDQQVQAWSRQVTDGYYESIATIPSQDEAYDEVWVVVKRTINGATKRYIEVFENMEVPDRQDLCFYLHSGLTYNAYDLTASPTAMTLSLSATAGSIKLTASDAYFAADDVGQRVRAIDADGVILGEAEITAFSSSTIALGTVKYNFSTTSYAAGRWAKSVSEISGLSHLEGKTVAVLADGGTDKPDKVVSSGTITLAHDYFVISVGLPYDQKIKTLPMEAGSARGTAQGKIQRINEIAFKVNRSHKGFKVGGTEDETDIVSYIESTTEEVLYTGTIPNPDFICERISFRDPATPMGTPELLYTGIIPNISFRDNYQRGSQITIINEDPLPVELLSIMSTLETFDK